MSKHSQWEQFSDDPKNNYYSKKNKKDNKITVVLYQGEVHLLGAPEGMEVVVMNLDKETEDESDFDDE